MFTPIGFFTAAGGGLPAIVNDFTFFYDAGESVAFTDQTGNGNDGTEATVGSGGTSTIEHNTGATPYWAFRAPSPTVEQKYIETGVAPGNLGTGTDFAMVSVFRDPDLTLNATLLIAQDGGTDQLTLGTSRTDDEIFCNLRGGANRQLKSISSITENQWYIVIINYDSTSSEYVMYLNNVQKSTTSNTGLNIDDTFRIGIDVLNSTTVNDQDVAATGWMTGQSLTSDDRTALYDYYNAIYSF